jgi:Mrp family chromosome partitioning ATPase
MSPLLSKDIELLSEITEIKRIYSVIENSLMNSNPACLVVTSGFPGEGKTTMAATLSAIAARQSDKRVLAMDLHWHNPALHSWFGLEQALDMEDLRSKKPIEDMAQSSGFNNLDILTARKSNQDEVVGDGNASALGTDLMRKARDAYDFVVVDTNPIFPTNRHMMDPVSISKAADGVALVVLANVTPRQPLKRSRMFLETAGANLLGVIVNQWKNPLA